jgi:MFS family permease
MQMRKLFRLPGFGLFFAAASATMIGESALLLVLAIWVKSLTGSSSLAGLTLFALAAPGLGAPVLGWVVDRFPRRPFLVGTLLATVIVLTPLLLVHDRGDVGIIYAVAVLLGASQILAGAATAGIIKDLLPDDLIAEANGALQTVRQGLRLIAPIGGAGLFGLFGGRAVAAVDIVCLLIGAGFLLRLRVREARPEASQLRWLAEVGAGLRYLFEPPALRRGIVGFAVALCVLGFAETVVFQYVDLGLHRGPAFVSLIVCVQGIGGLSGGLLAARVVGRIGELGAAAAGIAFIALSSVALAYPVMWLGFTAAIVMGFGLPLGIVGFNTLLIRTTPREVLGRTNAAADAMASLPQSLSIAGGAGLALVLDYRLIFAAMGVVMAGAAIYLWNGRALTPRALEVEPVQA